MRTSELAVTLAVATSCAEERPIGEREFFDDAVLTAQQWARQILTTFWAGEGGEFSTAHIGIGHENSHCTMIHTHSTWPTEAAVGDAAAKGAELDACIWRHKEEAVAARVRQHQVAIRQARQSAATIELRQMVCVRESYAVISLCIFFGVELMECRRRCRCCCNVRHRQRRPSPPRLSLEPGAFSCSRERKSEHALQ